MEEAVAVVQADEVAAEERVAVSVAASDEEEVAAVAIVVERTVDVVVVDATTTKRRRSTTRPTSPASRTNRAAAARASTRLRPYVALDALLSDVIHRLVLLNVFVRLASLVFASCCLGGANPLLL